MAGIDIGERFMRLGMGLQGKLPEYLEQQRNRQDEQIKNRRINSALAQIGGAPAGLDPATGITWNQSRPGISDPRKALAIMAQADQATYGPSLLKYDLEQNDPMRKLEMDYKRAQLAELNKPELKSGPIPEGYYMTSQNGVPMLARMGGYESGPQLPETTGLPTGMMWGQDETGNAVAVPIPGAEKKTDLSEVTIPDLEIAPGASPTKEDAKTVKNVVQAKRQLDTLVSEYADMVDKFGFEAGYSNDAKMMNQKIAQIQLQMKNLEELGALQAPDLEILKNMIGSPVYDGRLGGFTANFRPVARMTARGRANAQVESFQDYLDDRFKSVLQTRGYVPSQGSNLSDDPLGLFQ